MRWTIAIFIVATIVAWVVGCALLGTVAMRGAVEPVWHVGSSTQPAGAAVGGLVGSVLSMMASHIVSGSGGGVAGLLAGWYLGKRKATGATSKAEPAG